MKVSERNKKNLLSKAERLNWQSIYDAKPFRLSDISIEGRVITKDEIEKYQKGKLKCLLIP